MAHKCSVCGSTDTSTGLHTFTCLICGAVSEYTAQADRGRVPNPDGPSHYYGDDGVVFDGGGGLPIKTEAKPAAPVKKAAAKKAS